MVVDPDLVVPDDGKSLNEGAISPWSSAHVADYFGRLLDALAEDLGFSTSTPWRDLPKKTIALVLAGGRGSRLFDLTDRRAKPAVYFGGKFRIIDFALSNCLNSGIRRIGVLTQYKSHSLLRHLQRGWNFLQGAHNEFIDLLPAQQRVDEAASLLRRAIRKDARLSVAHYYLGAVLFRQGDTAGAERAYLEADRLAPEDPRALTARCQLHAHTGNAAAVSEVKRVLAERFPDRASALTAECSAGAR